VRVENRQQFLALNCDVGHDHEQLISIDDQLVIFDLWNQVLKLELLLDADHVVELLLLVIGVDFLSYFLTHPVKLLHFVKRIGFLSKLGKELLAQVVRFVVLILFLFVLEESEVVVEAEYFVDSDVG